ncbi:MAG: helix-turn-helix domain-containing protein [Chloroflexi bacterium]|nr:helix-turn-helix domain-containing protein [Chloroflexota bacterium]
MTDEWFTLDKAAKHLGVSTRTLRRWIHAGKLKAELRPGPYGQQYLVPSKQLGAVQLVRDAERVERGREAEAIPQLVEDHLRQRDDAVRAELALLREEIRLAVERIEDGQDALLAELRALRQALDEAGRRASPSDHG